MATEQATIVRVPPAARLRLRVPTGAALLSIGTLASGVLAYAFNLVAARSLGASAYGPVAVLWAAMFLVSVVLFRPAEQTLSRNIAERLTRGEDARVVARSVGRLTLAALALVTVATVAAWGPITDKLFSGHGYLTACLLLSIVGYALSYYVRGIASGLQWFGGYGVLLLVDGAARVALVVPLAFVASPQVAAAAMVAAAFLGGIAPLLAKGRGPRSLWRALQGAEAPPLSLGAAARFAVPVGVIAGTEQVLVSGGALLAALAGGGSATAAAGTVFAATMLVRAPVFLFQGVAAALLPRFTELHTRGDQAKIRRALTLAGAATLGLSAVSALGALAIGPQLMKALFGPDFVVARGDLALLAGGVGCYLAAATLSQAALARGLASKAAAAWLTSGIVFVGVELALGGSALHKVSAAFTAATALAVLLLATIALRRQSPRN